MRKTFLTTMTALAVLVGQSAPAFADRDHGRWNDTRSGDHRSGWQHDDDDDGWSGQKGHKNRHGRWDDRDDRHRWSGGYVYDPPRVIYRGHPVRSVSDSRRHIVYYHDRPDVVYVRGEPRRYYYDNHRRGYYYKDKNDNAVLIGVALGAVGLAAVLAASR